MRYRTPRTLHQLIHSTGAQSWGHSNEEGKFQALPGLIFPSGDILKQTMDKETKYTDRYTHTHIVGVSVLQRKNMVKEGSPAAV